jgi:hypothetical protein
LGAGDPDLGLGLTNPSGAPLRRVPVRARTMSVTLAAWSLSIAADEGEGAIVLLELPDEQSFFRGDGLCLGWPQERLAAVYAALAPREEAAVLDLPQLG